MASALERIVAIASSRESPATSVSHTNASIPNVAPMPWTSRANSSSGDLPAQRRERVLDPADPHPPVHRQVGRPGAIRLQRQAQDRALLGLELQDPVGVVPQQQVEALERVVRRVGCRAAAAPRCAGTWRPAGRAWSGSSGRPSSARSPPLQRRPPSSAARRAPADRGQRRSAPPASGAFWLTRPVCSYGTDNPIMVHTVHRGAPCDAPQRRSRRHDQLQFRSSGPTERVSAAGSGAAGSSP